MMKKTLIASGLLALFSHSAMAADDWRFAAGVETWNAQGSGQLAGEGHDYDDNYNWNGYLQLEHDVFLLPNAKLEMADFSTSGGSFDNEMTAYDLTLYYRLFNNDMFQIDLGATGRRYDGDFNQGAHEDSYEDNVLMAYTSAEMRLGSGFALFGDLRMNDASNKDYRLGASYKFSSLPIKVRAGWREAELDFDKVDQTIDGWFFGGEFTF
jgi:outer membrane protein